MKTVKTIVILFDCLNAQGAEGRNAKKRVKSALQREHICWRHGTVWTVYLTVSDSVKSLEGLIARALGAVSLRLGMSIKGASIVPPVK